MSTTVQFLDDWFPLIVCVAPMRWDDAELRAMFDGYRRYFERGERYSLLSHTPKGSEAASAAARKKIADWANSAEVRSKSRELCVGSATVVPNAVSRGALTAILWLWKPASPHIVASSTEEGLDWCTERLREANVAMPHGLPRERILARLREI